MAEEIREDVQEAVVEVVDVHQASNRNNADDFILNLDFHVFCDKTRDGCKRWFPSNSTENAGRSRYLTYHELLQMLLNN